MIARRSLAPAVLALACLAVAVAVSGAVAQDGYPAKPIKLIVPLAAGGGIDFTARATAQKLSEVLGQQVVVENQGGGGARSPLWRQIQADVYGREVEIVAAEEGAAYGAAILAGTGAGAWASVEQACDAIVRVANRISPNEKDSAILQGAYGTYRRIYPALRQIA